MDKMKLVALVLFAFTCGVIVHDNLNKYEKVDFDTPEPDPNRQVRGFDFKSKTGDYIYQIEQPKPRVKRSIPGSDVLTDDEIRHIRENLEYSKEGYYLHTPGRYVPTREQEIEDYIEDNIDDIRDYHGF